jgi:hypothetical protein
MRRAALAALLGAAGVTLAVDARAVACGCFGELAYHARGPLAVWAGTALLLPLLALALWLRARLFALAAAVATGGALSNAVAAGWWGGVPDYLVLRGPGILVSAGDLAIWAGLAGSIAGVAVLSAGHLRRGGSLGDDVRVLRAPRAS